MASPIVAPSMGKQIADSFAKVTFEDRIAQMIMAICYTTRHIDVAVFQPKSVAQLTEIQAATTITQKDRDTLLAQTQAKLDKKDLAAAQAKVPTWKSEFEGGLEAGKGLTQQELQQQGTKQIFRTFRQAAPKGNQLVELDISEIDFDTTAVIIQKKTLCIAFNFKVRTQDKLTLKYKAQYSDFGKVAWSGAIDRIQTALNQELSSVRGDTIINNVVYVGIKDDPTDEKANAAPHAEMQLVKYLQDRSIDLHGLRVGCSKSCCSKCAEKLGNFGVVYSSEHANTVTTWSDPTVIEPVEVRTYQVAWYG